MTDRATKKPPTKLERELAEKESKFVSETGVGFSYDDSEGEGEPFDFGIVDDKDSKDAA